MTILYKDLTEEDIKFIRETYTNAGGEKYSKTMAQEDLAVKYGVTERSIRNWIKNLGLVKISTSESIAPAKILVFDIETAPMEVRSFQKWGVNIGDNMIMREWFIISWSAKWLFEDKMYAMVQTKKEALAGDDKRITQGLWNIIDEADIIVAHNLNKFDRKKINTRILFHGMFPPSPYKGIDTLRHIKKQHAVTSNRLDYIAQKFFGIEGKIQTEKDLWNRCLDGDVVALKAMDLYCQQDVRVLESVYLKLRHWIKPHPNMGLHIASDVHVCATCGSDNLHWGSEYHTFVNVYDSYRCGNCGSVGRSRVSSKSVKQKSHLTVITP